MNTRTLKKCWQLPSKLVPLSTTVVTSVEGVEEAEAEVVVMVTSRSLMSSFSIVDLRRNLVKR